MARNLPRKLFVSCPVEKGKPMKKWFKFQVVTSKKKDHAVTRNEKRLALQRKNQLTVKREKRNSKCNNKRKVRILKPYCTRVGKENRKHKLFRPPQCCDAGNNFKKGVSECHGSKQDRLRETVEVTSTGLSLAVAGFSHDHCYPQSSSLFLSCLEDSLQTLLETCDVDVDFLQKAKPSHDVLFDEVLNHCDVPPDEMFSDIEDDADGRSGARTTRCKCCLAFAGSAPSKGIFTTAGSTETQLSTCAFPQTLQTTPLAVLEREVQQSVDFQTCPSAAEDWMSCTESSYCPAKSVSSELGADFRCPLVNDGGLPSVDHPTCTGAKTGDDDLEKLKLFLAGVGRDKRFGSAVSKFCPPWSSDYSGVCKDGDSVTTRGIRTTQSKNRECAATTHIGSIDDCSGRVACFSPPCSSPSSCPLVHSLPSFHATSETSLEASSVPSSGRKRKQGNGIESSGKRCKTDSASPSPIPSLEADATSLPPDSCQDIPIPPSLSPCWDLPIFHTLAPPLSPLSDDSGVLGSDDDAGTLGNTSDDGDDRTAPVTPGCGERDELTSKVEEVESRTGCVTRMGEKDGVSPSSDKKDVSLRPGDGVVRFLSAYEEEASCLDNHYKLFRQALPLSPITNSRFDRCV